MAVLKVSVSGPPESGKTALLALIKYYLTITDINAICSQERLANSPKMESTPDNANAAVLSLKEKNTAVVLTEWYETEDGTLSTEHDRQRPIEEKQVERVNPLS